jgi:hypothetical protein
MRITWLFCTALVGTYLLAAQAQIPDRNPPTVSDPYSVSVVDSALQFIKNPERRPQGSPEAKRYIYPLLELGDRVSVAVLKIYDRNQLIEPENAEAYLTTVRNAFSDRRAVLNKSDLDPKVTLFVLEYLQEKETAIPGIEKRIDYMKLCVKDFACSSQGEYNFFHEP